MTSIHQLLQYAKQILTLRLKRTFQRENVVRENDDFVISSLVEFDEELSGAKFVGVHGVQKDLFHARHRQVFAVKFRRHRTPHFRALNLG